MINIGISIDRGFFDLLKAKHTRLWDQTVEVYNYLKGKWRHSIYGFVDRYFVNNPLHCRTNTPLN